MGKEGILRHFTRNGRRRFLAGSAVLSLFAASACKAPAKVDPNPAPVVDPMPTATAAPSGVLLEGCSGVEREVKWSITPSKVDDHHILYFSPAQLAAIFADPTVRIGQADLEFNNIGKDHKDVVNSIELDVNGIQTFGAGPPRPLREKSRDERGQGSVEYEFNLTKIKLNGTETFIQALERIARNKGSLILALHGASLKLSQSSLELKGKAGVACPTPTATPVSTPTPLPSPTPIPAPVTSISSVSPTAAITSSATMTISFTGDQAGLSFVCSLDSAAESSCTSPIVYSDLGNGDHAFRVVAINASGVRDPVGASYRWTVDRVAPSATITNAGSLAALSSAANISFQFSASKPSTFQCSLDGAAFASCSSPAAYFELADGAHLFRVRATDALGNIGEPAQFGWTVDRSAPGVSLVDVVPPEPVTRQTGIHIVFTSPESATHECRLDQSAFAACVSPFTAQSLADGIHSVEIRATDLAGNTGVAAAYSWTIDTVAPVVSLSHLIPAAGLTSAQAISAEFSANEAATYLCGWDGAPASACASPFQKSGLSEGLHELVVQAIDLAGNPSAAVSVQWVMDHTLPTLAWGAMLPSSASRINSTSFESEVISSEPVTLSCSLNGALLPDTASPIRLSGLSEGAYQLDVSGRDAAGNASNPLGHSFVVDLTAPNVTLQQPLSDPTNRNSNTLSFFASESSTFECSLDQAGFAICASPVTVSGLADGEHVFEVRATDQAGNRGPVASAQWSVDTVAPVVTAVTVVIGRTSVTVNWTTSEPTTGALQWGAGATSPNTTAEDTTLSTSHSVQLTGLAPATIYTIIAIGKDAAGNAYSSAKKQFRTNP